MKPATHAHVATRLDLLEQKVEHLEPGGGGDTELSERIFRTTFFGSYTNPPAYMSPHSKNTSIYDQYGSSLQIATFGTAVGAPSVGALLSIERSFWGRVFDSYDA